MMLMSAGSQKVLGNQIITAKIVNRDFKCKYFIAEIRQHCLPWRQVHALQPRPILPHKAWHVRGARQAGSSALAERCSLVPQPLTEWHRGYVLAKSHLPFKPKLRNKKRKCTFQTQRDSRENFPHKRAKYYHLHFCSAALYKCDL